MHLKNVYYETKFVLKSQIKITKNLRSGPNCSAYIFGPVDIMVIDKTDSLGQHLWFIKLLALANFRIKKKRLSCWNNIKLKTFYFIKQVSSS